MAEREGTAVVDIAGARLCICGHARRHHMHCSDRYPALCTYEIAPGEDYPIYSCLEFEDDEATDAT